MGDEGISVAFETTRNERVDLLFVSQCFLQIFLSDPQERKEPPKCASMRGIGGFTDDVIAREAEALLIILTKREKLI